VIPRGGVRQYRWRRQEGTPATSVNVGKEGRTSELVPFRKIKDVAGAVKFEKCRAEARRYNPGAQMPCATREVEHRSGAGGYWWAGLEGGTGFGFLRFVMFSSAPTLKRSKSEY
jgi:hypothetical protein